MYIYIYIFIYIYAYIDIFADYIKVYIYIYIFTTEGFLEAATESRPEWDSNPRLLNSVQTL